VSQGTLDEIIAEEAWSVDRVPMAITLPSTSLYENYSLEDIFNDDDFAPRPIAPARLSRENGTVGDSTQLPNTAPFSGLPPW